MIINKEIKTHRIYVSCPKLSASKWQSQDIKPYILVLKPMLSYYISCLKIVFCLYVDSYMLLTKYAKMCLIMSGLYKSINFEAYINP